MANARAAWGKKAALAAVISFAMLAGCAEKTYAEKAGGKTVYPAGTAVIYGYGQPQYLKQTTSTRGSRGIATSLPTSRSRSFRPRARPPRARR